MTATRPVEHAVFPSFLQNHSVIRPGLDLADPRIFDRFLRFSALFSRGLVVVDSDLNNNAVFHNAAQRTDGLFWPALRTGFLRRATRTDHRGNLLTQREVAAGLRKSSRPRFDLIPTEYPAELDAAISRAENETPPLIWSSQNVGKIFGSKLLALLKGAKSDQSRDAAQQSLINVVAEWVSEQQRADTVFGAADIESQLRPPAGAERLAWEAVWPIILEAHVGNIPLVFDGRLAVTSLPEANDRMLPAGPESGTEESAIAAQLYAGIGGERDVDLEVRNIDSQLPVFNISMERLDALKLEQIEELREAAEPEAFLEQRFRTAGSGAQMAAGEEALRGAVGAFTERLATAGIALTTEAQRTQLRSDFWGPSDNQGIETKIVAVTRSPERTVEYAMLHSFPIAGLGPQVLGCDFTWLVSQLDRARAQELYRSDIAFFWTYKRPDFRVVKLLAVTDEF